MFGLENLDIFEQKVKRINQKFSSFNVIQGFITGVITTTYVVDPRIFVEAILMKEDGSSYTFSNQESFNSFLSQLINIYKLVEDDLYTKDLSFGEENLDNTIDEWIKGFIYSSIFWRDEDLVKMNSEIFNSLMSIVLLGDKDFLANSPIKDKRFYNSLMKIKGGSSDQVLSRLKGNLISNLYCIYDYSTSIKVKQFKMESEKRKETQSRNSLCSCGSGKKYKRCCGK
jgi:hypothetical protein